MAFRDGLARSGSWLFKYRSWFPPLLLIPLIASADAADPGTRIGLDPVPTGIGFAIAAMGLAIRALVVGHAPAGTSGKNRDVQMARSLTTTGMYSVTRHPLYLANYLLWLAPAVATGIWWTGPLVTLAYWLVYGGIIMTEEAFLRENFGSDYARWVAATPAVIPSWSRWQRAALPFSIRTVLRQEYYAFFTAVFLFFLLEIGTVRIESGRFSVAPGWLGLLAVSALISGGLRALQRHSRILDVQGR